jgi:hypothetical protein
MTALPFFLIPLVLYTVPVALGTFAVLRLMDKKVGFALLVYSVVPICSWLQFVLFNDKGKTLSNFLAEPLVLAVIVCVLIAIHFILERRGILTGKSLDVVMTVFDFLVTLCVVFLMPGLPE